MPLQRKLVVVRVRNAVLPKQFSATHDSLLDYCAVNFCVMC